MGLPSKWALSANAVCSSPLFLFLSSSSVVLLHLQQTRQYSAKKTLNPRNWSEYPIYSSLYFIFATCISPKYQRIKCSHFIEILFLHKILTLIKVSYDTFILQVITPNEQSLLLTLIFIPSFFWQSKQFNGIKQALWDTSKAGGLDYCPCEGLYSSDTWVRHHCNIQCLYSRHQDIKRCKAPLQGKASTWCNLGRRVDLSRTGIMQCGSIWTGHDILVTRALLMVM